MAQTNRILIADDNQANCELLDAYLADLDCEVDFAGDDQRRWIKCRHLIQISF